MNLGKNVERNEKPLKHEKCSQRNTFILRVLKKRKHSLQKFPPPGNENKKSKKNRCIFFCQEKIHISLKKCPKVVHEICTYR